MRLRNIQLFLLIAVLSPLIALSQTIPSVERFRDPLDVRPIDKVSLEVDDTQRVALERSRHPLATPENMTGEVLPDQSMAHMVLVLRPDAAQEEAIEELIRAQQDPASRYYHQWLTPETFGERFGVSQNDLAQVVNWLETHGMKVDEIPSSRRAVVFSGTAGQVESTFHTPMRKYSVQGETHFANATDPEIPLALAPVVRGIVSLDDFRSVPAHTNVPAYTLANGVNLLMPLDWDTIYDVLPLYSQGLDGSGQSIAVIGRTDIALSDVETFRAHAALPAKDPQKIFVNGVNPGMPDCADEAESALDVEWAGAMAKNATIDFVSAASGATDGVVLAAQYAVTHNVAPIVTMSYLHCENTISGGGQSLWGSLWAQAASQGQSVFVASGDSGAAGCDLSTQATATQGKAVNAICSTPNSTCVGGTEFNDESNPGAYWSAANGAGLKSALGYIPEAAWNESSWAGMIIASGGGVSTVYPKPGWQSAPGVPADGKRDVPDVAMTSAIHDAYVIEIQGGVFYVAGTSAATPSFASVMALVLQNTGSRQGNANPALYTLATQQLSAGGPPIFHDITSGNNSVPGVAGYNAELGYDLVTGLGSVNAFLLVNSWANSRASNFSLSTSSASLTMAPGSSKTTSVTMTAQGGFSSAVALSTAGAPSGITVAFSSPNLTTSAPVTVTVSANTSVPAGTYPITITGTGGGFIRTVAISVAVPAATFTLTPNPTGASVALGRSASFAMTIGRLNGFNSAVAMSVSGIPAGASASFSPASIAAGSVSSTLTVSVGPAATVGVYVLGVTGTSGSLTQTQSVTLSVANPNWTFAESAASASVGTGGSVPVTLTTTVGAGFNSTVYLSVSGLPSGVSASFSKSSIPAPGVGNSTVTLSVASTATPGAYSLTLGAVGGGTDKVLPFSLTVLPPASFTLTPSATTVSLAPGGSTSVTFTTARVNGFSSAIWLSITGLPAGVSGSISPQSIASPGAGSAILSLSAASTAAAGSSTLTLAASGGGVAKSQTLKLTVLPTFTFSLGTTSASVARGGSVPITVTTAGGAEFNSPIGLSVSGVPAGVTASFSSTSIAAPGSGSRTLTLAAGATAILGTFTLTVSAAGGGITKAQTITLKVTAATAIARYGRSRDRPQTAAVPWK